MWILDNNIMLINTKDGLKQTKTRACVYNIYTNIYIQKNLLFND